MKTIQTMDLNECAAYLREHGLSISNESLAAGLEQRVYAHSACASAAASAESSKSILAS